MALLDAFQSGPVFLPLITGLLAFFVGVGLVARELASSAPFRLPALILALGAILIMGEIMLAVVLLSQIGNLLILVAGVGFARSLLRRSNAA